MNIQTQPTLQYPTPIVPRHAEYQYTLVVDHADYAENPREWDNLGTFVSFGNSCYGADETYGRHPEQFLIGLVDQYVDGFEDRLSYKDEIPSLVALLEMVEKYYVILPVFKYEHSGVAYNTSGFDCRWDSGQMGFIYVAKEQLREEYDWNRITSKRREKVEAWLSAEINVFSQWADGNVYGFTLYYHDIEKEYHSVEAQYSCGGFYHDLSPTTLEDILECGIAEHLPNECLNDHLVIVFEHW